MIQFLRVFTLLLLILVTVGDPQYYRFTIEKEWIYIISVATLIVFILIDGITGTLFVLTLIAAYIKLYDVRFAPISHKKKEANMLLDEITPLHLRNPQSNVIDKSSPNYNKGLYTAQGSGDNDVLGNTYYPYAKITDDEF